MQENENHQDHQRNGLEQRNDDLPYTGLDRQRRVQRDQVLYVLREVRLHFFHHRYDLLGNLQAIGARQLVDCQDSRRPAVQAAGRIVGLGSQFHARHVLDADLRAVGVRAHDDIAEFFSRAETAPGSNLVGELGSGHCRRAADLASGGDYVLLLDRPGDIGHGQAQLGQLVGLDPHPHGVITATEHAGLPHALDAGNGVENIDGQVVALEVLVIGAVG